MKEYLIFHYAIDGVGYVEAYPRHTNVQAWIPSEEVLAHAIVSSPSRNQARRAAWANWLSHVSWNAVPYRAYVLTDEQREQEHVRFLARRAIAQNRDALRQLGAL